MDSSEAEPLPATAADGVELVPFTESRWPPAAAVFMFMILNIAMRIWLPREPLIAVPWLLPALEAVVLGVLVFGDPADVPGTDAGCTPPLSRWQA